MPPDDDARLAWTRTERGTVTVKDRRSVLVAARACREQHGLPEDALPPRASVDGDPAVDVELRAALETLLSCGHSFSDVLGVEVEHANTLVSLSPWPPWPAAEELRPPRRE